MRWPTRSGSEGTYQQRRSGNLQHEVHKAAAIHGETPFLLDATGQSSFSAEGYPSCLLKMEETSAGHQRASTTWPAMLGNGVSTGWVPTCHENNKIRSDQQQGPKRFFAAVRTS